MLPSSHYFRKPEECTDGNTDTVFDWEDYTPDQYFSMCFQFMCNKSFKLEGKGISYKMPNTLVEGKKHPSPMHKGSFKP